MSPFSFVCNTGRAGIAALLTCLATPLAAAPITIVATASSAPGTLPTITLHILNQGTAAETVPLPEQLAATIKNLGSNAELTTRLQRAPDTPQSLTIPPRGFADARYRLPGTPPGAQALLTPTSSSPLAFAPIVLTGAPATDAPPATLAETTPPPQPALPEAAPQTERNRFLASFYSYGPVYAVYGPSKNAEGRIQFGFKYRLFGSGEAQNPADSRTYAPSGLYLAYTQRMFWDLGTRSVPFRDINYLPEIFYQSEALALDERAALSGRIGIRHESNGRAGPESRTLNQITFSPSLSILLDHETILAVAPEFHLPVGHRRGNEDILAYRGTTGLSLSVGAVDGILLSTAGRFSFSTGRGALNAELSYPLPSLWRNAPRLYLFLQGFSGYGENMLEYKLHTSHLRFGLALVR